MSPGELYLNTLCFLIRGYDDRDLGTQRLMLLQPRVVTLDIVQYDPIGLSAATLPLLRKVTSVCVVTLKISAIFLGDRLLLARSLATQKHVTFYLS